MLPTLGIAPRLPRPQRGVLLLDYVGAAASGGSGYRSRFSTLRRLYATMYNNPPMQSCVHRDSNPNLILGRDKYYPCTMDARVLETQRPASVRAVAMWASKRRKRTKIREGRFELPTKGSLRTQMHTLQSSALPLSYPRDAPPLGIEPRTCRLTADRSANGALEAHKLRTPAHHQRVGARADMHRRGPRAPFLRPKKPKFPVRDLNPGRAGESRVS